MRRYLLFFTFFFLAPELHAAIAFVPGQTCVGDTGASPASFIECTLTGVTAGNLLIVSGQWDIDGATATLTDTQTETILTARAQDNNGGALSVQTWYIASAANSGSHTLRITLTAPSTFFRVYLMEYSGQAASPLESSNGAFATSNFPYVTTTVTSGGDLIFSNCGANNGGTVGSRFTARQTTGFIEEDRIASLGGTVQSASCDLTAPSNWIIQIAVFKANGASAATGAAADFSPTDIPFGNQNPNTTSAPQTITLTNNGNTGLTFTSAVASTHFGVSTTCGGTVTAGSHCNINVTFTPNALGTFTGTVTVTDSASDSPQVLNLYGTGAASAIYYVDFATGADTNNGTATGTPWKHAPGMQNCASTCASTTLAAADRVIFKGGVTWDNTCWSWVIVNGGSLGNSIYFGVNQTWFTGGSWTQPVFDGEMIQPTAQSLIRVNSVEHIIFDNIEMKNLLTSSVFGGALLHLDTAGDILMENLNLHGWDLTGGITNDDAHGAMISTAAPGPVVIDHTTISNLEFSATHNNGVAIEGASMVSFSTIHDLPSFCLGCGTVHDSVIYDISYPVHDFDGTYHTNGHYMTSDQAADYNNLYYNFEANAAPIYPNVGSSGAGACQDWTQYIYNNVVILAGQTVPIAIEVNPETSTGAGFCGTAYVMNNTIQSDSLITAIRSTEWTNGDGNVFVKNLTVRNNHVINSTGANTFCFTTGGGCGAPQTLVDTNSVFQTNTAATSQGYTSGNQYQPTGPGGITVAAGLNLFSLGISALDSDKLGVPRPSVAAWDAGAYEFNVFAPGNNRILPGVKMKPGTKIH